MKEVIKSVIGIIATYLGLCFLYGILLEMFLPSMLFRFHYAVTLSGITTFGIFFINANKIAFKIICAVFVGYFVIYGINRILTEKNMNTKMMEKFGILTIKSGNEEYVEEETGTKGENFHEIFIYEDFQLAKNNNVVLRSETEGGKMYTYVVDRKKYSDIFIPFGLIAKSPDQIGYLLLVEFRGTTELGRWIGTGKIEYEYYYTVSLVDIIADETIFSEDFYSNYANSSLSSRETNQSLDDYISGVVTHKDNIFYWILNRLKKCVPLLSYNRAYSLAVTGIGKDLGNRVQENGLSVCSEAKIDVEEIINDETQEEYKANDHPITVLIEEEDIEHIYELSEVKPQFPGGEQAMMEFIKNNIIYPVDAKDRGIQGRVSVQFVVETDGSISEVQVQRGIEELNDEAIRVIKSMPNWQPGKQRGKAVRVRQSGVSITFRLDE